MGLGLGFARHVHHRVHLEVGRVEDLVSDGARGKGRSGGGLRLGVGVGWG